MIGGLHARTLYAERYEQIPENQVADARNQQKADKESLIKRWKEKPTNGSWNHGYGVRSAFGFLNK